MKRILLAAVIILCGCMRENLTKGETEVVFNIEEDLREFEETSTRGYVSDVLCTDENGIGSVQLILYRVDDGSYEKSVYITDMEDCSIDVDKNTSYKVLALVNTDETIPPEKMEDTHKLLYTLPQMNRVTNESGLLPMAGEAYFDSGSGKEVSIYVSRLVAEINISYENEEGVRFRPSIVYIANAPCEIYPFAGSGSKPELMGNGDFATLQDIREFNNGQPVRMFMLENANSLNDVPAISTDTASPPAGISWLEIQGTVLNTMGISTADVVYRIALDFKIIRNKRYHINFHVTPDGIAEDSWRVTVTDGKLDMGTDTLYTAVGGFTMVMPPAAKYTRISYNIGNPSVANVSVGGIIRGLKKGITYVRAYADEFNASGSVPVKVIDEDEDILNIDNASILLGGTDSISFFASRGYQITVNTAQGPLCLDITPKAGAPVRTVEDSYLRLSFDPDMAAKGIQRLTATVKRAIPYSSNMFTGMLISRSLKYVNFSISTRIPDLNISVDRNTICETGENIRYEIGLTSNGESLTRDDFESELYDRIYGNIRPVISEEDSRHISVSDYGYIFGISADGNSDYDTEIIFRDTSFFKDFPNGTETVPVTVTPAFKDNGGYLGDTKNNALRYKDGKTDIVWNIPQYNLNDAMVQIRKLGWDRKWETGSASGTGIISFVPSSEGLSLQLDNNASGPYAVRLSKRNSVNGKIFTITYYSDIYLTVETGIHFPWKESMMYVLDMEAILNYSKTGSEGCRALEYIRKLPLISVNSEFKSSQTVRLIPGERIESWNTSRDFFFDDTAHALLPLCINFMDSIIYNYNSFNCRLVNPFTGSTVPEGMFRTDMATAERYFGGDNILMEVNLSPQIFYTITHYGCDSYPNGATETNRL